MYIALLIVSFFVFIGFLWVQNYVRSEYGLGVKYILTLIVGLAVLFGLGYWIGMIK